MNEQLEGAALDLAVAMTGEWKTAHELFPTMTLDPTFKGARLCEFDDRTICLLEPHNPMRQDPQEYSPSTNWAIGGPLIERDRITLNVDDSGKWWAERRLMKDGSQGFQTSFDRAVIESGPTPLVAAMRVVVASRLTSPTQSATQKG